MVVAMWIGNPIKTVLSVQPATIRFTHDRFRDDECRVKTGAAAGNIKTRTFGQNTGTPRSYRTDSDFKEEHIRQDADAAKRP
jgi:hypothetical protein